MQQPLLESRPLYGIGTVARLTGLKPDTLRAWERRYGFPAPGRDARGHRSYSSNQIEELRVVKRLQDSQKMYLVAQLKIRLANSLLIIHNS